MKKGFTLIELLVVIAVIAILTSAVIFILNPIRIKRQARDSARKSALIVIAAGLSGYEVLKESYPKVLEDLVPGEMMSIPKSPTGANFSYRAEDSSGGECSTELKTCEKAVLYDIYEAPVNPCSQGLAYLSWTSKSVRLGKVCSVSVPTPDDVPTDDF